MLPANRLQETVICGLKIIKHLIVPRRQFNVFFSFFYCNTWFKFTKPHYDIKKIYG